MTKQTNLLSHLLLILLGICLLTNDSSFAETNPNLKPGMVVVAKVSGTVKAITPPSKKSVFLKSSDTISENDTVVVGSASSATLAFSNGAVVNLLENTTVVIAQFLQDPFSSPFTKTASTEPSTSATKLNLVRGQMITSVKKLRTNEGSSLSVTTPVGAAGVRGTIFSVSYLTDPDDASQATYTLSVTEGSIEFTGPNGEKKRVDAGKEVVIRVRQSVDPVTGKVTILEILSTQTRNITQEDSNQINVVANEGIEDSEGVFQDVLNLINFDGMDPSSDTPFFMVQPPVVTFVDP